MRTANQEFAVLIQQYAKMQLQVAEKQIEVGGKSTAQVLHFLCKEDDIMSFGENLQMLRKKNQLSQEGLAEMLQKLSEDGSVCTAGGAAAIRAEADRYDTVLDPFGTADR